MDQEHLLEVLANWLDTTSACSGGAGEAAVWHGNFVLAIASLIFVIACVLLYIYIREWEAWPDTGVVAIGIDISSLFLLAVLLAGDAVAALWNPEYWAIAEAARLLKAQP